jgi:tetratricopeptide (TPR) repeat protein
MESYPRKLSQVAVLKDRLLKENAVLHYNLGVFHIKRQEYNEAISEFEKTLELNPNDPATHYNLGVIYADFLNNRTKAIMHFKRYLMGAPKDDRDVERARKYLLTWETWEDEKLERNE